MKCSARGQSPAPDKTCLLYTSNCWICLGVPQSGEEDQVKIIGTLCRKIIHKEFIHQLQQGDTDQVLALLNQTLSS